MSRRPWSARGTIRAPQNVLGYCVGTSHGVLRLLDRFDLIAIQTAIAPATRLVGSAVLYLAGASLEAFLVVWFFGTVLARLTMLAFGWREVAQDLLYMRAATGERGAAALGTLIPRSRAAMVSAASSSAATVAIARSRAFSISS